MVPNYSSKHGVGWQCSTQSVFAVNGSVTPVNLSNEMLGNLNSWVKVLPQMTLEDIMAAESWDAPWMCL